MPTKLPISLQNLLVILTFLCKECNSFRILCIGDSLTRGTYDSTNYNKTHPYTLILDRLISKRFGLPLGTIVNKGQGGETVYYGMKYRLLSEISTTKYDMAILMGGINDLINLDVLKQINLPEEIANMIKSTSTKVKTTIALTLLEANPTEDKLKYVNRNQFMIRKLQVNQKIRSLASDKIKVCDTERLFRQQALSEFELSMFWTPDLLHPTPKGYDYLGLVVFNCIKSLLFERLAATVPFFAKISKNKEYIKAYLNGGKSAQKSLFDVVGSTIPVLYQPNIVLKKLEYSNFYNMMKKASVYNIIKLINYLKYHKKDKPLYSYNRFPVSRFLGKRLPVQYQGLHGFSNDGAGTTNTDAQKKILNDSNKQILQKNVSSDNNIYDQSVKTSAMLPGDSIYNKIGKPTQLLAGDSNYDKNGKIGSLLFGDSIYDKIGKTNPLVAGNSNYDKNGEISLLVGDDSNYDKNRETGPLPAVDSNYEKGGEISPFLADDSNSDKTEETAPLMNGVSNYDKAGETSPLMASVSNYDKPGETSPLMADDSNSDKNGETSSLSGGVSNYDKIVKTSPFLADDSNIDKNGETSPLMAGNSNYDKNGEVSLLVDDDRNYDKNRETGPLPAVDSNYGGKTSPFLADDSNIDKNGETSPLMAGFTNNDKIAETGPLPAFDSNYNTIGKSPFLADNSNYDKDGETSPLPAVDSIYDKSGKISPLLSRLNSPKELAKDEDSQYDKSDKTSPEPSIKDSPKKLAKGQLLATILDNLLQKKKKAQKHTAHNYVKLLASYLKSAVDKHKLKLHLNKYFVNPKPQTSSDELDSTVHSSEHTHGSMPDPFDDEYESDMNNTNSLHSIDEDEKPVTREIPKKQPIEIRIHNETKEFCDQDPYSTLHIVDWLKKNYMCPKNPFNDEIIQSKIKEMNERNLEREKQKEEFSKLTDIQRFWLTEKKKLCEEFPHLPGCRHLKFFY